MLTLAHWIAPNGERLDIRTSHIAAVIADPNHFAVTEVWLRTIYAEHGESERFGCEGRAREVIIRHLVTNDWIRTRQYLRPATYWSMTVYELNADTRQRLKIWLYDALAADWLKPTGELRVYSVKDDKTTIIEAAELQAPQ